MKFLKWRKREKIEPIHLLAGDILEVTYEHLTKDVLIKSKIGRKMTINEVGIFDAKVEGRDAIGGVIIQ